MDEGLPKILVVDDEDLVTMSLERLLTSRGYGCTAVADVLSARRSLARDQYALVLCDIQMPGESGLDLLRDIAATMPGTATLMITGTDDSGVAQTAIELGAYGYIVKPFRPNEILINVMNALRRLELDNEHRGHEAKLESMLAERSSPDRTVKPRQFEAALQSDLTQRELEILGLMAQGLSSAAMAAKLFISPNTIRNHVQRILEKLGVHSKLEAVAVSLRSGLVEVST